jgi:hypothetical protein
MYTKLFTLLLMVCLMGMLNTSDANDRYTRVKIVMNGDALRGDTGPLVYGPPAPMSKGPLGPIVFSQSDAFTVAASEIHVDGRTQYDLQANGNTRYIYQNPSNALEMHATFMVSTDPGPNWADRNLRYFYTNDGGTTWDYLGTVTTTRSGFPSLTATNDGRAVISGHSTDGGGINRLQLYVDLAPGVGSWTRLDPGANGNTSLAPIWPEIAINPANNHVVFAGSQNGVDSAFRNVCTSLTGSGTFTGYTPLSNGETAEQYSPAVGTGIIGIAYNTLDGGAAYISSNNNGTTWSAPTTILSWNPADSMGTLRSIDLRFEGSTPQVVIGLLNVDPVGGTFTPGLPSKLVFWSPSVNGGNPVTVDSAAGLNGSNTTNDVFVSVTRGVIGKNSAGALVVAYNKSRQDTSSIGNNFFDVWLAHSVDGGATWSKSVVTNLAGQFQGNVLHDCRYPSISPSNAGNNAIIVVQADSVAASNVNGAPASSAKMYLFKVADVIGIQNISNEVPANFSLSQNYPNPFNPTTKIRFAVPKAGFVTLKIYDALGKEVGILVAQQVSAGTFEYELNAQSFASGVYFYRLQADNFVDTKKLVLVK